MMDTTTSFLLGTAVGFTGGIIYASKFFGNDPMDIPRRWQYKGICAVQSISNGINNFKEVESPKKEEVPDGRIIV